MSRCDVVGCMTPSPAQPCAGPTPGVLGGGGGTALASTCVEKRRRNLHHSQHLPAQRETARRVRVTAIDCTRRLDATATAQPDTGTARTHLVDSQVPHGDVAVVADADDAVHVAEQVRGSPGRERA